MKIGKDQQPTMSTGNRMLGLQTAGGLDVDKQAPEVKRKIPVFLISGSRGLQVNGAILRSSCGNENGMNDMRLVVKAEEKEVISAEKMI